jgi:hypothetical protein
VLTSKFQADITRHKYHIYQQWRGGVIGEISHFFKV